MFKITNSNFKLPERARIFPALNVVLFFIIVFFVGYIIHGLLRITKNGEQVLVYSNVASSDESSGEELLSPNEMQPFSYYSDQLEKRDIFRDVRSVVPVENTIVNSVTAAEETPAPNLPNPMELVKNLSLVGIVVDRDPMAIIEDQQSKETLFLHLGGQINEAIVEKIEKGKVILNFHGQRVELTQ